MCFKVLLISSKGEKIKLTCTIKGELGESRWFLLTALIDDSPVGFTDVWLLPDSPMGVIGKGEYSYTVRTKDYNFPYSGFRDLAGEHGFYVCGEERGRGIGKTLMFTAMELLKMAGARAFYSNLPPKELEEYYERLGGERYVKGYEFLLE